MLKADLIALLVPLMLAQDVFVGSGINTVHAAKAVACQDHVALPADIHAIHHPPIPLIADPFNPSLRVQVEQLHLRSGLNVKALQVHCC